MKKIYKIKSADNINLSVREYGYSNGQTIIFLHGFNQSYQIWKNQFESVLSQNYKLIIPDLRGHGASDKPVSARSYTKGEFWADDLASIISYLKLYKPFIVAWSYAGYMLCDYLEKYGDSNILGINFVAAAVKMTKKFDMIGSGFLGNFRGMTSSDLETNKEASQKFINACFNSQILSYEFEKLVDISMQVPPIARLAMGSRKLDFTKVLDNIAVPVLISVAMDDKIILPEMSEFTLSRINTAKISKYKNTSHALFIEQTKRFNEELSNFIGKNR